MEAETLIVCIGKLLSLTSWEKLPKNVSFGNDGDCLSSLYVLLIQGLRYMLDTVHEEKV